MAESDRKDLESDALLAACWTAEHDPKLLRHILCEVNPHLSQDLSTLSRRKSLKTLETSARIGNVTRTILDTSALVCNAVTVTQEIFTLMYN
ncbi:hypothetical protein A1F96_01361 [Pyrenophora tritici-repentis]|nr:hypothetical protein TUN205_01541 [Pyrenophora tritici-repentis]KAI1550563.1 hypothetical protein PtrSN001A_000335 [Pyrenophora tritici-repentis]PZD34666.1 hypothetical protein A1F96_01361 [Pyrenophora tritici-repentis]